MRFAGWPWPSRWRSELGTYDRALYGLIAESLPEDNEFTDCYAD